MPTYEYACTACGHEWEQTQRITEAPIEVCPVCGKPKAHRLISAGTNFILKGSGWYSDLYASPKPSSEKKDASDKKDPSESKKDASEKKGEKSDSNAATPSETAVKSPAKPASTDGAGSASSSTSSTPSVPST
jgi:putative FmdB family regulatory protein